ncbi:DNA-binding GntR family transcriptional regulator [Mobilisporobacter senegalensis]|uniref:DNA-binding GntR family transcriptional regulator n=1 Tax=Mobilisporobacter senegalensis TaxID=1329262 RepID=A0A3N1XZ15_9FIRM|nr:GntR family transcriptional regulator [Mobilisporobacter senegalensis]ROR31840.1 DNA-binding GntR family transcriptional regulator [Mobilisporobacter senegalensis]
MELSSIEESYSKEIYQKIKSDILNGAITDGEFLTLAELAHKYQVSKTPIRDALGTLESKGYLISLPRKGYLVKPVTGKDMKESLEMRIIFEKAAARLAILNANDKELEQLYQLAEQLPARIHQEELLQFNHLNDSFHMAMVKASHNSQLVEMYGQVMESLTRMRMQDTYYLTFPEEKVTHAEIARALINRDIPKTEELLVSHIYSLDERLHLHDNHVWNE